MSTRYNFFLWLLTGKSSGFVNAGLNSDVSYHVTSTPAEVIYARNLLGLNDTNSDVNCIAVLAATMISKSWLRELPKNTDGVFVNGLLRLIPITCSAPLLSQTDHSYAYIDGSVGGRLGFNRLHFLCLDNGDIQLSTDTGINEVCQAAAIPIGDGTLRLHIKTAQKYGVFADFNVPHWNAGDYINLTLARTRFPYTQAVARLRQDRTMLRLMNSAGTLATFEAASSNPALQVGMAGAAIILHMLRQVDDERAGYTLANGDVDKLNQSLLCQK